MGNQQRPPWRTVPYIAPDGRSDVLDYLNDLRSRDVRAWQRIENIREQFIARGPFVVGPPYWEGVGGGLYEIRSNHYRVYCSVESEQRVVMYVAVFKLWKKFRHRTLCDTRRADFLSADYDEQKREYLYLARSQKRGRNGSV